jgi:hypothetical protein
LSTHASRTPGLVETTLRHRQAPLSDEAGTTVINSGVQANGVFGQVVGPDEVNHFFVLKSQNGHLGVGVLDKGQTHQLYQSKD